ncbi:DUF4349 domain-containing protein [Xylanibacillus composti]|uniref:DUF4349 domain-containing protein n=1 Tax=Xylanibacillus composti TaxID=1572762 RepID=A0A8J4H228_9BACL|nr:DUF4349 domain-containing protein [Xylanibacillus composti]MDT9724925.1 DUF4349 domain-containing protein [Xylanibacillus composti]GIQ68161.1 DUF4349 domain-containing protein [Xylanibacillus composti]
MRERMYNWHAVAGKARRVGAVWLAVMLLASLLSACGGSSDQMSIANQDTAGSMDGAESSYDYADQVTTTSNANVAAGEASRREVQQGEGEPGSQAGMEQAAADNSGLNRKLIYKADVVMEVKAYADAQASIRQLAHLSGGYILNFEENESRYDRSGTFTLKVPSQGFSSFLDELDSLEPISLHRSVEGTDVTSEYVDLEARLRAKRVVESRLLAFMEQADSSQDLLAFSNELAVVQEEIERILGRMRYLDQNVAYSTVTLHVHERLDGKSHMMGEGDPFYKRAYLAMGKSLQLLKNALEGMVVGLAAMLPVLLFLALVALPFVARYRRNRKSGGSRGVSLTPSAADGSLSSKDNSQAHQEDNLTQAGDSVLPEPTTNEREATADDPPQQSRPSQVREATDEATANEDDVKTERDKEKTYVDNEKTDGDKEN